MNTVVKAFLLTLILVAMASGAAYAQFGASNTITINPWLYSTAYDADCSWVEDGTIQTLGLYLYDPVNPTFGADDVERPVEFIDSVEVRLEFTAGLTVLNWSSLPDAVISNTANSIAIHYPTPLPVAANPVQLAFFDVWVSADGFDPAEYGIGRCVVNYNAQAYAHAPYTSRIPGYANFTDAEDLEFDPLVAGVTSGSDFADFRFAIHLPEEVATDRETFDSLKALYR